MVAEESDNASVDASFWQTDGQTEISALMYLAEKTDATK